jgi:hypothetical protein
MAYRRASMANGQSCVPGRMSFNRPTVRVLAYREHQEPPDSSASAPPRRRRR